MHRFVLFVGLCLLAATGIFLASTRSAQAVNQIGLTETCTDAGLKSDLISWPAGDPRALQTWVDVSLGQPGGFTRYGPFAGQSGVNIIGIPYQTAVFVRVTQILPNGAQDFSPLFAFETSWCGYNYGGTIVSATDAISGGGTSGINFAGGGSPGTSGVVSSGQFIPFIGNGQGPTLCADGLLSRSAGRGTCSGHGGIAR